MSQIDLDTFLTRQTISAQLSELLRTMAASCAEISGLVRRAALAGALGEHGAQNVQGEIQQKLDVIANDVILQRHANIPGLAGMASEELDEVCPTQAGKGAFVLLFDPLDGSSNIPVNISIGTIFSVLPRLDPDAPLAEADFLQPGRRQVAAGYAVYGPQTSLVLTVGGGVHAFSLCEETGAWRLVQSDVAIGAATKEFAINMSNQRRWEAPVRRYIDECLQGATGPRAKDFNMRWVGSMVADVHRLLMRGGVFMYPRDDKSPSGKLRLLYEANPMAFVVEQAGGGGVEGAHRLLDLQPERLHQRVGVFLGATEEIERLSDYHR